MREIYKALDAAREQIDSKVNWIPETEALDLLEKAVRLLAEKVENKVDMRAVNRPLQKP